MASEFWDYFAADHDDDDDLDETIETAPAMFEFMPLAERIEALHHACASAYRLRDTVYWQGAHDAVNQLLDDIVGR